MKIALLPSTSGYLRNKSLGKQLCPERAEWHMHGLTFTRPQCSDYGVAARPFLTSLLDANKTKSVEFDVIAAAMLSSSNVWCVLSRFSCIWLCATLWIKSLPGSSVHRILQAGVLEWAAMPSSRGSSRPRDGAHITCGSCLAGRFFTAEPPGKPKRGVKTANNDDLIYLVPSVRQTLIFSWILLSQDFNVVVLTLHKEEETSLRKTKWIY